MSSVELKAVTKRFGRTEVIKPMDLALPGAGFTVIVGPSGCGKSTLLRLIAGLEEVSSGQVLIDGQDVTEWAPKDRGVAMVFQSYALYPHMSVFENMAFSLRMAGAADARIRERVELAAQTLKIANLLDRKPRQLSGGQRQRVAIGRAIVREPSVFLFDEPLSNLDAALRVDMRLEISRLHNEIGKPMIYVTHDQVEAMTLADTIVVLKDGAVEQAGPPLELYDRPANIFVAGFIGAPAMNFLPVAAVDGDTLRLSGARQVTVPGLNGRPAATLGLRPDALRPGEDGDLSIEGSVAVREDLGAETILHVADGGHGNGNGNGAAGPSTLTVRVAGKAGLREGERVRLSARVGDIHLFDADGRRIDI